MQKELSANGHIFFIVMLGLSAMIMPLLTAFLICYLGFTNPISLIGIVSGGASWVAFRYEFADAKRVITEHSRG